MATRQVQEKIQQVPDISPSATDTAPLEDLVNDEQSISAPQTNSDTKAIKDTHITMLRISNRSTKGIIPKYYRLK